MNPEHPRIGVNITEPGDGARKHDRNQEKAECNRGSGSESRAAQRENDGDGEYSAEAEVDQHVGHVEDRSCGESRDVGGIHQQDEEKDRNPLLQAVVFHGGTNPPETRHPSPTGGHIDLVTINVKTLQHNAVRFSRKTVKR